MKRKGRFNAQVAGNILERAIHLDDFLESRRATYNRDQRISAIRGWLNQEYAIAYRAGKRHAKATKEI